MPCLTLTTARTCGRLLRQADDPLSHNLDFDCAGCVYLYQFGGQPPDMPPDELRAWLRLLLQSERERRDMVDAAILNATGTGKASDMDAQDLMILIGSQRLIQEGLTEDEARAKVIEAFSKPLPFRMPTIDEL